MLFEYYFEMAGMILKLESTYEIQPGERLEQFSAEKQKEDLRFRLYEGEGLPSGQEFLYGGDFYKIYETETKRFRTENGREGAAVLERKKDDSTISILQGRIRLGGNALLNAMALEEPFLQFHAFFLHASFIKWQKHGILFTGPSGVGKSTQADLWKQYLGADIVNGDRALIRRQERSFTAYGSVYAGSSEIYKNDSAAVSAIIVLEQAEKNQLEQMEGAQAFARVYSQSLSNPWNPDYVRRLTEELMLLLESVPVFLLKCRPEYEAVRLVKDQIVRLEDE